MGTFKQPFPDFKLTKKQRIAGKIFLKSLIYALSLLGVIFIGFLVIVLQMFGHTGVSLTTMPEKAVLAVDLDQPFAESNSNGLWQELSGQATVSFYDLIKTIEVAAQDEKVKALVTKVQVTQLGLAQIQDLRQAIQLFQAQGKKAYLFSSGMGNFGGGTDEYYLASVFDEIWMQPHSEIGVVGVSVEVPFAKDLLQKLGVQAEFYARYEYKNAANSALYNGFTLPQKQEMQKLVKSIFQQMKQDICHARQLDEKKFIKLVNEAPLTVQRALSENLIDHIAYYDEFEEKLLAQEKGELITMADYMRFISVEEKQTPAIAFVALEGVIDSGKNKLDPMQGEMTVGAESVIEQLKDIEKNSAIKGLVLRINSPGGSYQGADEIRQALLRLKQKRKMPIVVSMGDYAASGGYFVALSGDKMIAQASSVTGSIGVLGGKVVFAELWNKLGVHWQSVKIGENAGILSLNRLFSPQEKKIFNRSLDNVYADFTKQVSLRRGISSENLDKLARGRVWTGIEAWQNGLIDEVGGIHLALSEAKNLAGIAAGEKFQIIYYPKAKTFAEQFAEMLGGSSQIAVNHVFHQMGLDIQAINMLKRVQYETVLAPFELQM